MKAMFNRRTLLKGLLGSGLSLFTLHPGKRASAHDFSGYDSNLGVLVDLSRCVGCRSCEAACNKEQGLPPPQVPFSDMGVYEAKENPHGRRTDHTRYTVVNRYDSPAWDHPLFKKTQCNHCLEPACLTACFVNAYTKSPEGCLL